MMTKSNVISLVKKQQEPQIPLETDSLLETMVKGAEKQKQISEKNRNENNKRTTRSYRLGKKV